MFLTNVVVLGGKMRGSNFEEPIKSGIVNITSDFDTHVREVDSTVKGTANITNIKGNEKN